MPAPTMAATLPPAPLGTVTPARGGGGGIPGVGGGAAEPTRLVGMPMLNEKVPGEIDSSPAGVRGMGGCPVG